MEEGRVEGKHEANTETAQRLLAMGLSAEQVAKATQLPLEIIKNLSNSKKRKFGTNSTYSFRSLANSQTTMPAVTLTFRECLVPN